MRSAFAGPGKDLMHCQGGGLTGLSMRMGNNDCH